MNADDKKRNIDDPELNQDASTYDKDESFDDTDDFHKYDDTENSNVDQNDAIAQSNAATNHNARNHTPTFTRTYDKNATDEEVDKAGKFDGDFNV
ncbi:hypothetical protein [Flavobacterium selenitireducens]|uniref:hypothetical protein n=1 Tax=Flavobacterium selenitireducens TaxID=2722704 RepID=UPI00168AAB30|nr:hypothetical protein [Flavobacterium selenitireducens]MBD3580987.1 hypothetical protein [Flavobacterium selenitireducens]